MKQRAKRLMALFMAGVFALSTCMTSGPYTVMATEAGTAGVTTPSEGTPTTPSQGSTTTPDNTTPSGTPEEGGTTDPEPEAPTQHIYNVKLPEKIKDVDWGNLQVTYGEEKVAVTAENTIALNNVITDSSAVGIESDNYSFADITVNEGTINVATATPKLSNPEVKGKRTTLSIDEKGEYSISNIPDVWKDKVTWSVQPGAENITTDGVSLEEQEDHTKIKVIVSKEGYEGANEKPEILVAHIGEVQIGTFNFNVTKKNPELSLKANPEPPAGWKTEIKLLVSGEKDFNEKVIVSDENGQTQEVAVENGKAEEINWNLSYWTKDYKFVVTYAGDKVYKSESISLAYNVDKETQQFELTQSAEQEDINYGGSEKQIASIAGTKSNDIHPWNYSYEWENGNNGGAAIRVDGEKLLFTPGQAGTYKVTIKRSSEDYNECSCTLAITVKKKALTVKNVTATNRVYDGTDKVEVTAAVDTSEILEKDRPAGESLQLTTAGKVQGDGKLEGKDAAKDKKVEYEDFSLGEDLNSNYELVYANNKKPDVKVDITKKELTLAVVLDPSAENVKSAENKNLYLERQYTDYKDLSDENKNKVIKVVADTEGFIKGESAEDLAGYKTPDVTVDSDLVKSKFSGEKRWDIIDNALIPDENSTYDATNNYKFNFENAAKANLKLTPQSIDEKIWKELLTVASDSQNVYQNSTDKKIYYSEQQPKINWKIDRSVLPVQLNTDLSYEYNEVQVSHDKKSWIAGASYEPKTTSPENNTDVIYVRLANESGGMTEPYMLTLNLDDEAPSATIKINENESVYNFMGKITFGLFNQKGFVADISNIRDESKKENNPQNHCSGIKKWSYLVEKLEKDTQFASEVEESEDTENAETVKKLSYDNFKEVESNGKKINLGSEEDPGNFAVFVLVEDNVGNKALYGSNGVIVENVPVNSLTLEYGKYGTSDENTIGEETKKAETIPDYYSEEDDVSYFKNDISIYAIAKDNTENNYSGIKKIEANLTNLDTSEQKKLIEYSAENKLNDGCTLDELKKYSTVTTESRNVTVQDGDCVKYQVTATAEDGAGNNFKDESVEKTFVIDRKPPKVKNSINRGEDYLDGGRYYSNKDVVLKTEITERFTDESRITINLQKDDEEVKSYTLKEWIALCESDNDNNQGYKISFDKNEKISSSNDYYGTITFTIPRKNEGNYSYWVEVEDYANNSNVSNNTINFCIDITAPEVDVTYKSAQNGTIAVSNDPNTIAYLNGQNDSFTGTITVKEKNMMPVDKNVVDCVYDGVNAYRYTGDFGETAQQDCNNVEISGSLTLDKLAGDIKDKNRWTNDDSEHTYKFTCTKEANYKFPNFTVTDLAGNPAEKAKGAANITLDWTVPTGDIQVTNLISGGENGGKEWINTFLNALTFGLYGKDYVDATITSTDIRKDAEDTIVGSGSGIAEKSYYLATDLMSEDALNKLSSTQWTSYNGRITMAASRSYIVYEKVVDKAGNLAYYSSDRVIVDKQNPQPEVTITPTTPGWGKGVYSASDNPGFDVYVVDPAGSDGSCAGLAEINCTITDRTTGHSKPVPLASFSATSAPEATYRTHVSIDPAEFYSNEVQVTVEAKDHSTNPATVESQVIKIDNKAPIVTFSFDKSDVHNGKYYNNDKTLTITVDERNFDESYKPQVTSTAGGGYSISGWSHNGEIHTATVTFSGDSDYTVTYDCYDLAGNKSNTEKLEEFTVDKTKPAIQVSYDNNNALNNDYYKDARTATITITEHNFNPGEVTVTTTAQLDGAPVAAPGVSGWSGSGDTHVATVSYSADADYTFTISATDLASNVSEPYATDNFTVDQTKPTVEITNIEDHSANNGEVAPVVTLNDINFDSSKTVVHLTGANKGEVDTTGMYTSAATAKGQTLTFHNFAENMDDIYTLTAEATDKAGNVYSTSKMFSVNRDGSTYMYDSYTDELIKNGYTNDPKNLVVSEINVDTLTFQELTVTENGTLKTLEQDKDYEVKESGSEVSWKEYKYTINASNFEEEGDYNVSIYSEDRATNVTTNTSKSKDILFAVDKTSPVIALSNIEDGGRYKVESQKFTANVDDNMALDKVEYYVDGKLQQTFDASEVAAQSGSLELSVDSSSKFQKVSVKAYDKANNEATSADADVLVSASSWVQFYNNKPAFYGTIGGGVAVLAAAVAAGVHFSGAGAAAGTAGAAGAGGFFFLAGKKKKDEEETK